MAWSPSSDALLDLSVPSRTEGFRWDLLDTGGGVIGALHPQKMVTIANTSSGSIKRKASGFVLPPDEAGDVDPITHRVQPVYVLRVGGSVMEWPLGVLLFGDASTVTHTYGSPLDGSLSDLGLVLSSPITQTIAYPVGASVGTALREVAELAGFPDALIDSTVAVIQSPVGWVGSNSNTWGKVLTDLCAKAGFYDWYFTSTGLLRMRAPDVLSGIVPELRYGAGGRIARGSIVTGNDLLSAPNLWKVIDTAATTGEVVGTYELPASTPHSFAARGYFVTEWIESPGIGTQAQADAAALAAAQSSQSYETISWASPIDPRHETFDPVDVLDFTYVEESWQMRMEPGGASMRHTARRVFG